MSDQKPNLPIRPKRRVSIFTIVLSALLVLFLGVMIYNYFATPSRSLSETHAIKLLKDIGNSTAEEKKVPTFDVLQRGDKSYERVIYSGAKTTKITAYNTNQTGFAQSVGTVVVSFELKAKVDETKTQRFNWAVTVNNLDKFKARLEAELPGGKDAILLENLVIKQGYPTTLFSVFSSLFTRILIFLPGPLLLLYIFYMFRKQLSGGLKGMKTTFAKQNVFFSDVAGIKEEKNELLEIVSFLKKPQKYLKVGARIPKGLLLYGPPGTGKTLLAKAVSGESGVPFYLAAGSSFEQMYVGVGASRVRDLFAMAKKTAPCIIFIDEIDSLGSKRQSGMGGVQSQTLNQFLSELDGFESNVGVIVIAATNRFESLDPALLRSGRFDRKIQINLPDVREREAILKLHARNKKTNPNVDFTEVASRTPGFSGAELENSLNEAALQAVRKNRDQIDLEDIDEGIDRVIGGPAKTTRVVNKRTRTIVSLHESGHALIGLILAEAAKVQKVTIIPRGMAGGYTITTPKDESSMYSKHTLTHQVIGLLGGRAAEELILGIEHVTTGAYDDFQKATTIVENMVKKFGMSKLGIRSTLDPVNGVMPNWHTSLSETAKTGIDNEINRFLEECLLKAKEVIGHHQGLLFLIAESLLILETITAVQIEYIYQKRILPSEALSIKQKYPDKVFLDLQQFQKTSKKSTAN